MTRIPFILSAIALLGLASAPAEAQKTEDIKFNVKVDASKDGKVLCALYDDEDSWLSRDVFRHAKKKVGSSSWVTCTFKDVPPGTYGIAAIHDEDNDEEMDKTLGIPEEGYTTSRDAQNEGLYPDWEDAEFDFSASSSASQMGHMKY